MVLRWFLKRMFKKHLFLSVKRGEVIKSHLNPPVIGRTIEVKIIFCGQIVSSDWTFID